MKSLVALTLVVAQLLGWSAAPMYLCVSDEGAVCLDSGSGNCAGCDSACHDHDQPACCETEVCGHSCRGIHDESPGPVSAVLISPVGCDCLHLLVSWPQPLSVVSSGIGSVTTRVMAFDGLAVVNLAGHAVLFDVPMGELRSSASSLPSHWLTAPGSAVLRC